MKKPNGYVALSMAVLIGTVITGAIIYLANQGGIKSKQLVGDIQTDQEEGELKQYVTKTAALFREELFKGVDPANPSLQNDDFNSSAIDFKCQSDPDYKNPKHHYVETTKPAGKTIVYTCKELSEPEKGAIITAYYSDKGTVDASKRATAYVTYRLPLGRALHSKLFNITRRNKLISGLDTIPINAGDDDLSAVYLHDLVTTSNTQFVKFLLNDKTVIHLGPDSEFYFKKYYFKKVNERSTLYRFLKGTLQVLYGTKNPSEDLIIETPSVSLGVRGTEYNLIVRENLYQYHVTLDVVSGEVDVFDKNKNLIKTVKAKETFNHYQSKTSLNGLRIDGDMRNKENTLYVPMPLPTPDPVALAQPIPIVTWPVDPALIDKAKDDLINVDDLIKIRQSNLLLYGYFHNAKRDKDYFKEIKTTGGWGGFYQAMRPSLINEALFLPHNASYDGMELSLSGTNIIPKSFDIALMSPNNFDMALDPNLNFSLVYKYGTTIDQNSSFLLIYPTENLDSLAQRLSLGRYSNFDDYYMISPISGLKLLNGDIVGCSGVPCSPSAGYCIPNACDLGGIRSKLPGPTDYEASRLVQIDGAGNKTVTPWPPIPTPVPTVVPIPSPSPTSSKSKKKPSSPKAPPKPVCTTTYIKTCKSCLWGPKTVNCGTDPNCTAPASCGCGSKGTKPVTSCQ